jgi:hypothetical protein
MKKILLVCMMLAVTTVTFGQTAADSTFANSIHEIFGISFDAILWIVCIAAPFIGHFVINNKWASIFKLIQSAINWFMEHNRGEEKK